MKTLPKSANFDTECYRQACAEFNEKHGLANIAWMAEELRPSELSEILLRAQQIKLERSK